jgi:hypothetical protein
VSFTLPAAVYILCFITSAACAWLLGRGYARTRARLLLWSTLCFVLLAANNALVVVDLLIITERTFRVERLVILLAAVSVLLAGFIWDLEE